MRKAVFILFFSFTNGPLKKQQQQHTINKFLITINDISWIETMHELQIILITIQKKRRTYQSAKHCLFFA